MIAKYTSVYLMITMYIHDRKFKFLRKKLIFDRTFLKTKIVFFLAFASSGLFS